MTNKKCEIHECNLDGVEQAPVFYGFFGIGIEYGRASRRLFRNSRSWEPGGCSVAAGRPDSIKVEFCTLCRQAELKWIEEFLERNPDKSEFVWRLAERYGIPRPDVPPGAVFPAFPIRQTFEQVKPQFPCPYCGKDLGNEEARQCFSCGMDWHNPENVVQRGNPNWNRLGLEPGKMYVVELLQYANGNRSTQYREADAQRSELAVLETVSADGLKFIEWGHYAFCEHLLLTDGRKFGFDANGVWLTETEIQFMQNVRWWERSVPWENGITPSFELPGSPKLSYA